MTQTSKRWIKLYCKLNDWGWHDCPEMVALWIHLLINANYGDANWHGIDIKRGQLLTSLNSLREKTGISLTTLRTCLKRMQLESQIVIEATNHYSLITLCNYEAYQSTEEPFD